MTTTADHERGVAPPSHTALRAEVRVNWGASYAVGPEKIEELPDEGTSRIAG